MARRRKHLNRYTTLPVLLDMLRRKRLVLLDPKSWDDRNDSDIILEYKRRKKLKSLFALCFSLGDETIHHWKAFADGTSGCCIAFNKDMLLRQLRSHQGVECRAVTYRKLNEVRNGTIRLRDIPFTKRWPYRCEEEFRAIWCGNTSAPTYEIALDLRAITKITISQRMPQQVYETIREYLREVFKNPEQRINRSTLYENRLWIEKFKQPPYAKHVTSTSWRRLPSSLPHRRHGQ